jgi:hypothetical protein
VLSGKMLQLHRALTAPQRVVVGAENATVVRYENERIALAAFRASRVRRQQRRTTGAFVVEPPLHRGPAIGVTRGRSHAALPGASLRRL